MAGITLNEVLQRITDTDAGELRVQFGDPAGRMIVRTEPRYKGVWSSLATALSRGATGTRKKALYLFTSTAETDFRLSSKSFLATFLMHAAGAFLILHFVHFAVAADNRTDDDDLADAKIYYMVPPPRKQDRFARSRLVGPEARQGAATKPTRLHPKAAPHFTNL